MPAPSNGGLRTLAEVAKTHDLPLQKLRALFDLDRLGCERLRIGPGEGVRHVREADVPQVVRRCRELAGRRAQPAEVPA